MPRLHKEKNEPCDDVIVTKQWLTIPLSNNNEERYLVNPRVMEYIERLEEHFTKENLPKL